MQNKTKLGIGVVVVAFVLGAVYFSTGDTFKGAFQFAPSIPKILPNVQTTPYLIAPYKRFKSILSKPYSLNEKDLVVIAPATTVNNWKTGKKSHGLKFSHDSILRRIGDEEGYGIFQVIPYVTNFPFQGPNDIEVAGREGMVNSTQCQQKGALGQMSWSGDNKQPGGNLKKDPRSAVQTRSGQYSAGGATSRESFATTVSADFVKVNGGSYSASINTNGDYRFRQDTMGAREYKGNINEGTVYGEAAVRTISAGVGQEKAYWDTGNQSYPQPLSQDDVKKMREAQEKHGVVDNTSNAILDGLQEEVDTAEKDKKPSESASMPDCAMSSGEECGGRPTSDPLLISYLKRIGMRFNPASKVTLRIGFTDDMDGENGMFGTTSDPCSGNSISNNSTDVATKTMDKMRQKCESEGGKQCDDNTTPSNTPLLRRTFKKRIPVFPSPPPVDPVR